MVSHVNYAMVAQTHTATYLMHKYWARKPHNVVAEYIKHYSKEGDIVLDPFAGSGVTAIEAIKLGRKAIAIDLDPMSTFITKMTALPVDVEKFSNTFNEIGKSEKNKINKLYETECKKCKSVAIAEAFVWEKDNPKEIRYNCKCSKETLWKKFDENDKSKLKEIDNTIIRYWYPQNELIWNSRVNASKGEKVSDLFTKRNIIGLSSLLNEIENIKDDKIKNLFKFVFTSSLAQASKIIPFMGGFKSGGPSWKVRGFWIPEKRFELNVWNCFENRYKKILRGKEESNNEIKLFKEAKNFDDIKNRANIFIKNFNTLELEKILPPNSVDYVFTDPPYGDAIPYLELNYLWSSWLKLTPNFDDEIIISDSPVRSKTPEIYDRMLKAAFNQIFRVLKNGKYMTVTFHNTDIGVWNSIINACIYAGFELEKIVYQPPAHTSSKAGLAPYGSAVGDYYIRFRKPEKSKQNNVQEVSVERYKRVVLQEAKRILAERGEPTPYTFILNGIIVELKREGALLGGKQNPDDIMKEFLNKEFVLIDAKDEKGNIVGQKWWLKNIHDVPYLELIPLKDRVETAVIEVLRRKVKASFDDILQEIFIKFPNALTPETQDIKQILEEYAKPTKDGNWMLKDSVKARESEHSKMIYYLALLGIKLGYKVWIGSKEQGDSYSNQQLSKLVTIKSPKFRFVPSLQQSRVRQIDVLWIEEDNVIRYIFEIENTTAITEAIVRGSNIPSELVKRVIIIPKERETLLYRKMVDPILSENIEKFGWKFIFYDDLENFFIKNSRKKEINLEEFDILLKIPKENKQNQNSLKHYIK
jgi:DNA modification methylase